MSDQLKHTSGTVISALGFVGSVTLQDVNTIVSIACGVAGFVAACLTIYFSLRHRNKRRH